MTNHKHLRTVIEDIYSNGNKLTEELTARLIHEFRYSNLYIPSKKEDNKLNFIIYEDDDSKLTPLFTDLDEFRKFYKDEDVRALQNPFELYQNVLKTTDIEGYILNPASEKYLFKKEFILAINNIPKTDFYTTNPYSEEELLNMKRSVDNKNLERFIENRANIGDFEGLFEQMANSQLFALMLSDLKLNKEMISLKKSGPVAAMYTDNVGGIYATLFTSERKMDAVKTKKYKYSQLVNLATLVNFILTEDMDGLIVNPESDNVLVPRTTLLRYSLGFEMYANDERLSESMFYLFRIE
ncbi:SseB protein N-terminal domain-containing protein [Methanobrevibacter gottschalkii]|uniref:Type III secretion system (T3SS) SseB-like protein n=2 Tax=Methanobrevibacter gottschalkii TaxID=190974 RepID=A0A3N5B931_9EURY|nr:MULTISPECIES: SseB family protein [Methanobrevibacter]MCQ2970788.1 SseB family protein [archaeon]RPF51990.1 type III secretion system (T3SS) SseB-like protein [Methanobrevibacter gottschalkii DSM 11977]SEL21187.1 SseB protein N-terminal domain-containing protein [Methanobrevibacter gottschalkii]